MCIVEHNLHELPINLPENSWHETCIGDCMVYTRIFHALLLADNKEPRVYMGSNNNLAEFLAAKKEARVY